MRRQYLFVLIAALCGVAQAEWRSSRSSSGSSSYLDRYPNRYADSIRASQERARQRDAEARQRIAESVARARQRDFERRLEIEQSANAARQREAQRADEIRQQLRYADAWARDEGREYTSRSTSRPYQTFDIDEKGDVDHTGGSRVVSAPSPRREPEVIREEIETVYLPADPIRARPRRFDDGIYPESVEGPQAYSSRWAHHFVEKLRGEWMPLPVADCDRFGFVASADDSVRLWFEKERWNSVAIASFSEVVTFACSGNSIAISGKKEGEGRKEYGFFIYTDGALVYSRVDQSLTDSVDLIEVLGDKTGFVAWSNEGPISVDYQGHLLDNNFIVDVPSACAARFSFKVPSDGTVDLAYKGSENEISLGRFEGVRTIECLEESVMVVADELSRTADLSMALKPGSLPEAEVESDGEKLFLINRQELVVAQPLVTPFHWVGLVETDQGELRYRVWRGSSSDRITESFEFLSTGERVFRRLSIADCEHYALQELDGHRLTLLYQDQPVGTVEKLVDASCSGERLAFLARGFNENYTQAIRFFLLDRGRTVVERKSKRGDFARVQINSEDGGTVKLWTGKPSQLDEDYVTNLSLADLSVSPIPAGEGPPAVSPVEAWASFFELIAGKNLPSAPPNFWSLEPPNRSRRKLDLGRQRGAPKDLFSAIASLYWAAGDLKDQFTGSDVTWTGDCVWKYFPNQRFPARLDFYRSGRNKEPVFVVSVGAKLDEFARTRKGVSLDKYTSDLSALKKSHDDLVIHTVNWKIRPGFSSVGNHVDPIMVEYRPKHTQDLAGPFGDLAVYQIRGIDYPGKSAIVVASVSETDAKHLNKLEHFPIRKGEQFRFCYFDRSVSYE